MSWGTIILSIVCFILLSGAIFFAVLKDWRRATFAVWADIFIILAFLPGYPWEKGGILSNLIFALVWSGTIFLFAKEKKRSAFWASLLTLTLIITLSVLFP